MLQCVIRLPNKFSSETYDMNHNENPVLCALTCPVCIKYMTPPIQQCIRGHSMCLTCHRKILSCPVCRAPRDKLARNWNLEKISEATEIPCENSDVGCQVSRKGTEIQNHEDECTFKSKPCPFSEYEGCKWNSLISSLKEHLESIHAGNVHTSQTEAFVVKDFKGMKTHRSVKVVLVPGSSAYLLITWDLDGSTGMTKWNITLSEKKGIDFSVEILFGNPLAEDVIIAPCVGTLQSDDRLGKKKLFLIHRSVIEDFCENGDLHYSFSIEFKYD